MNVSNRTEISRMHTVSISWMRMHEAVARLLTESIDVTHTGSGHKQTQLTECCRWQTVQNGNKLTTVEPVSSGHPWGMAE